MTDACQLKFKRKFNVDIRPAYTATQIKLTNQPCQLTGYQPKPYRLVRNQTNLGLLISERCLIMYLL